MSSEGQIQVRFITKQEQVAVPDVPLSVPASIETDSCNELVNQLLKDCKPDYLKPKKFDFLINGEFLRATLIDHLQQHNISTEVTVEVEYVERTPAPEPQDALLHDDWVSGIHTCGDKWILTGCYDNSVNIWTLHGKAVLSLKEHTNIVKDVTWINKDDPSKGFISVSHDLTGIVWSWEPGTNLAKPEFTLKGHQRGVDSVSVSPNGERVATGSWDATLKIWSTTYCEEQPSAKKIKGKYNNLVQVPISTLEGHKENISSVKWVDNFSVVTGSMDHTLKVWDAELCGIKSEIVGHKAFFSVSWSPLSNLLLASSADAHIRLYDPRSTEGSSCKTTFLSHTAWVSTVDWSKYDPNLFISGGYDQKVKVWDVRSPKAALYDLQGHEGQVLRVDWSNNKYVISGGTDNNVHIFKNKHIA